ncbi:MULTISPECIES: flagellar hook-associated protein FlgK [unclassified Nocardioides]|uniref:flagellar hook-associated protein FlgK n=1 Tax=unclassified Nocardioides TaxID=2615069 RepID=UPI0030147119
MSGSLSSLNTALTALQYQRSAMDVAASNVANATTDGYTRRRVNGETLGPSSTPALWSRQSQTGSGVKASNIERMTDVILDARARREHASQSYLDMRATSLARVEAGIGEPSDTGVAAAMSAFRTSWSDVKNNPSSEAARTQVVAKAQTLIGAISAQVANVNGEMADQQTRLESTVTEINNVSEQLAATNKNVVSATLNGVDTTALLDQRDQLAMKLAELSGGTVTIHQNGVADVSVGGHDLVTLDASNPLDPADLPTGLGGQLGAVQELLTTTLPAYKSGLDDVVTKLADQVNTLHGTGFDLDGTAGQPFFSYDAADPAGSLAVAITDPRKLAVSSTGTGNLDGSIATQLAAADDGGTAYQSLVNNFGSQVNSAKGLAGTQRLLTSQVDGARDQVSGVSLDEEMVGMLASQRAYEAASRVMTVVDSVLDTLINRTGLLR